MQRRFTRRGQASVEFIMMLLFMTFLGFYILEVFVGEDDEGAITAASQTAVTKIANDD